MCIVKKMKSEDMFPFIKELLDGGSNVRITVTGSSMYPFLREDTDGVELVRTDFNALRKGDIVLIQRISGQYILHRVLKKEIDSFYMIGDAQQWIEGPLYPYQLIAAATAIWRGNYRVSCSNFLWRVGSLLWIKLLPWRYNIIKVIRKIRRVKKHKEQEGALS